MVERPDITDIPEKTEIDGAEVAAELFEIDKYIELYGLSMDKLDNQEIYLFSLARKLEPFVRGLKIKAGVRVEKDQKTIVVEKEFDKIIEKTTYEDGEISSLVPTNDMDVSTVERMEDISRLLPSEWMIEEISPELFYLRMQNHEALKQEWKEKTRTPKTEKETIKEKRFVELPAPPEEERQHAMVLMDSSGSMFIEGDGRDALAKGLSLAFLRQGFEQRSILAFRPFTTFAHSLSKGRDQKDLTDISKRILGVGKMGGFSGGTNIEVAIYMGARDILNSGDFNGADLLLISDGEAELVDNPLGKIRLHTIIVGDVDDNETLKDWSTTYKHLRPRDFNKLFKPTSLEESDLEDIFKSLATDAEKITDKKEMEKLLKRISKLLKYYEWNMDRSGNTRTRNKVQELKKTADSINPGKKIKENKKKQEELEEQKQQEILRQEDLENLERLKEDLERRDQLKTLGQGDGQDDPSAQKKKMSQNAPRTSDSENDKDTKSNRKFSVKEMIEEFRKRWT